jgi:hypothetical protein
MPQYPIPTQDLTRDVAQADPTLLDDPDLQTPFKP